VVCGRSLHSLRKQPTFREVAAWALVKRRLSKERTLTDLGSAPDWLKENSCVAQPIRSTIKIWVVHVSSMEFLRSLLRRRFARAQVATARKVSFFLRLQFTVSFTERTSLSSSSSFSLFAQLQFAWFSHCFSTTRLAVGAKQNSKESASSVEGIRNDAECS